MNQTPEPTEFSYTAWRAKFLRITLTVASVLGIFAVAAALLGTAEPIYNGIYVGVYVILLIVTIFPVPYALRAGILIAIAFGLGVSGLFETGIWGDARLFMLGAIIMAALLFSSRLGWILTGAAMLCYALAGWLVLSGTLAITSKNVAAGSLDTWITGATTVLLLAVLIVNGIRLTQIEFSKAQDRAQRTEKALISSNTELQTLMTSTAALADAARAEANIAQGALQAKLDEINTIARIGEVMRGEQDLVLLSQNILRQLCQSLNAQMGAIFVLEGETLQLVGSYAYRRRKNVANAFRLGEGLVGQAAREKQPIVLTNAPADYLSLGGGVLELAPHNILALPFLRDGQVIGVIELATLTDFTLEQDALLEKALESIAIAFSTAQTRTQIDTLLRQTQQQAQELRVRETELRSINEELQVQAENLRASQEKLRRQQTDLQSANAELEERTATLQEQRAVLDHQNRELTAAQGELQRQAEELKLANKYKSEFLANMSHELRTPLNSLLILSRMFANNDGGNLTADQVESAQVIYNSGSDLLNLINEILDLSKVEAGRMTFHFEPMLLESLAQNMRAVFDHMADEKALEFEVSLAPGLPETIATDQQRVEQIVKNLLSNAFKFTEKGQVRLLIEPAAEMIAIRVHDSGIGMTPEQQQRVFEAFQQADGSTSRKYGGTGLGLTISREMAAKLGGRIGLESAPGQGSTFTLYLPLLPPVETPEPAPAPASVSIAATQAEGRSVPPAPRPSAGTRSRPQIVETSDDRTQIQKGDKVLLVIEDDPQFAKVLFDYAHKKAFKCLVASDGESGLQLAAQHNPDAILLDLKLPGMSGWEVLDSLKSNANLRHIPVHILSASDETLDAYKHGALGFLSKPLSQDGLENIFGKIGEFLAREIKSLLLVEDDQNLRHSVRLLLGGGDVKISEAASGQAALALLRETHFDCMILDLTLPDMTGFELLNQINRDESLAKCPVIVYTGQALTEEENAQLLKYANSVIIKGVKSPERLMDETALFLHRVVADMPVEKRETIRRLHDRDAVFSGKHVLVVDDDMRNAFALSRLLSDRGLRVTIARSGAKALETLETTLDIDLVLMDIMMPEMDGYETMQRVRAQLKFKSLPILALTAKAMKGDLEKCIAAGANDYLSKPIDAERLFSLLRVWLYR
jgi:CheY-like chemotaxis protein